jgi:D-inositol-3-phosphate glycosyltransferase
MSIEIAFFETSQISMDAQRPETLCGVNCVISAFLQSLKPLVGSFNFSMLVPQRLVAVTETTFQAIGLESINVRSYADFVASNKHNNHVVLQTFGHSIDRAAILRSRANLAWPVIGMTHDLFDRDVYKSLFLYSENRRKGDVVVCASRTAQTIIRHYLNRIESSVRDQLEIELPVVPHGIDIDAIKRAPKETARRALGIPNDARVFLYFGRLSIWQKADLCGLIRCFANQFGTSSNQLILAGGAIHPEKNIEIQIIMAELASSGCKNISVMMNVDRHQKAALFSAADVFVSPSNSLQEVFGLSLVEAMLYQLPVIATNWSGYREIVLESYSGHLIEARWAPSSQFSHLAAEFGSEVDRAQASASCIDINWNQFGMRMKELSNDRRRREDYGLTGLIRARRHFTARSMVSSYSQIWRDVLKEPNPARHHRGLCWGDSIEAVARLMVAGDADANASHLGKTTKNTKSDIS